MFNTKLEVDRHVETCMRKINNEHERNSRCLAFAKLYFKVGDFEQAHRYVIKYLNAKPNSAEGQHLLGKTLERLNRVAQALEAYRISLDLDPKQNNLVLKICELMSREQTNFDPATARYYCEKAQAIDPNNPTISHLKERIVAAASKDPNDVTNLLLKELETRPLDVEIRVRLLRHLLQNNRTREAYTHAYDIEQKHLDVFLNSLPWYDTVVEVVGLYRSTCNVLTWEFWMMYVSVWDKLVSLSLNERTYQIDYNSYVLSFDQALQLASDKLSLCPQKQLVQEFWSHYTGQLCWHFATLLYKQIRKEVIKYWEASNTGIPLLFATMNFKPADLNALWLEHGTTNCRLQVQRWNREAAFRCTQAGNMLKAMAQERKSTIVERGKQGLTGTWRDKTFRFLFVTREQQNKVKSSYFVLTNELLDIPVRLPENDDLLTYTKTAQLVYPNSLHHHIWLGLYTNLGDFECSVFPGLQYSVKTLTNCAAETLNILDIQSFIYAATLSARSELDDHKHYYSIEKDKSVLPIACTDLLGSANQEKWLQCAYKMFTNQHTSDLSDVRMTLIRGIETIRCVGNHGLDARLLVQLATLFAERATKLTKQSEIDANEARAELFWKAAMHLLEKYKKNEAVSYARNRLFEFKVREFTMEQVHSAINDGKLFLGKQAMKKKDLENAMNFFKNVKDPYASFHQAQIYKTMADKETNQKQENVTSEMRSQNIILLTKARDCLYLTLDRLGMPGVDSKHPLNETLGTEIEKIERLLSRIDPDNNRNECDGMSDDNVSSIESENYTYAVNRHDISNHHAAGNHHHSTPFRLDREHSRRDARPSPERLDAQIRQLAASKDMALNRVLEQNKQMIESQKCLADELKSFRETVGDLTTKIHELTALKLVVDDVKEMKKTVDDLENLRTVSDMVYELKKEVAELKKDKEKNKPAQAQLSEEDLYVLDDDYAAEFAGAHSVSLNNSLYAGLGVAPGQIPGIPVPGRIPQNPMGYPSSPMYGYPMYPYGMGGLGVPGGFPPAAIPDLTQIDYRTMNLLQGYSQLASGIPAAAAAASVMQNFVSSQYQQPIPNYTSSQAGIFPQVTPNLSFGTIPRDNTAVTYASSSPTVVSRPAPVNVVITSSDPLPKTPLVAQPQILSVTIPPQHLKGNKVHNYQITMPSSMPSGTGAPSVLSQAPLVVSTQSIMSNVSAPVYSALSDSSNKNSASALGLQIEKSLNNSFNKSHNESEVDNSREEEHDPCPDFKPIIPLPDEVTVTTGEENETVLFKERAKLFRYAVKEWKERGIGELKILLHNLTGKVRILMRRDQVHKICANHYLESDMELIPMARNPKAYIWAANDFAEGEVILEKFCVQFKTPELATKFFEEFEKAKVKGTQSGTTTSTSEFSTPSGSTSTLGSSPSVTANLGGFKFTSPPTFKPKIEVVQMELPPMFAIPEVVKSTQTASPFATFTFTSSVTTNVSNSSAFSNTASPATKPFAGFSFTTPTKDKDPNVKLTPATNLFANLSTTPTTVIKTPVVKSPEQEKEEVEEYEPNVDFKPVVPLPDLIEVKTGEENAQILFESKAKLLRFDPTNKEWKERGVGQMKILQDSNFVRLVMRREQVHKVCCNHQLFKKIAFSRMAQAPNVINWCAQDFSEGVLTTEMFAIKFKTEEIANKFEAVIKKAQAEMDDNSTLGGGESETEKETTTASPNKRLDNKVKPAGFGEAFKSKPGDWECKNCLIMNVPKVSRCIACETPKNDAVAKATTDNSKFCFGVAKSQPQQTGFSFGATATTTTASATPTSGAAGFGDKFKPKEGSWECKECYTRNEGTSTKCASCETPKPGSVATPTTTVTSGGGASTLKGVDLSTPGLSFSFGMPPQAQAQTAKAPVVEAATVVSSDVSSTTPNKPTTGFGELFKPKAGSWECTACYTRNTGDYCLSCESPKDDTVPPKSSTKSTETTGSTLKGVDLSTGGLKFSFGMPPMLSATTTATSVTSSSTPASIFSFKTDTAKTEGFTFSLDKINQAQVGQEAAVAPNSTATTTSTLEEGEEETVFGSPHKIGFEFTPRSPRRHSSGQQQDDEADNSYYEEEEANVYFKPVVPLPDKIIVTTGEEDEEALYCHRAKLYRHTLGEWKERGIGDLKILFKKEQLKLRVLMRREQVHKICLNHVLSTEIKYTKKDDKTWLFSAPDFSDGEIEHSSFCLRFKTPEVADEFMKAVDDALKRIDGAALEDEGSNSDVEFISETQITSEEEQEAIRLGLPPKFMAYRQLPDCKCEQCLKEDDKSPSLGKSSFFSCGTPTSVFGTPSKSTFSFANFGLTPTRPKSEEDHEDKSVIKSDSLKDLLIKPSILVSGGVSISGTPGAAPGGIFGGTSVSGGFSTPSSMSSPATGSIFGKPAITGTAFSGGSLFGTPATFKSGNIFGGTPKTSTPDSATFSFADMAKNTPKTEATPITTTAPESATATFSFASLAKATPAHGTVDFNSRPILGGDSSISFASLAANVENMPFGKPKASTDNPFANLGAGAPVFGAVPKTNLNKSKANTSQVSDDGEQADAETTEHDPYYDPIIPLPDEVEVKTGEEDEEVLFSERGKLYRYANQEWKERGVGNFKVLYHPTNNTYRLLLRREAVHKIVLNQRITPDLELNAFKLSPNAWMWAGMNYSEDGHVLEKLAVRFKNEALSQQFHNAAQEAIAAVKAISTAEASEPTAFDLEGAVGVAPVENVSDIDEEEDEDDDEDYGDEDDDDRMIMHTCEGALFERIGGNDWTPVVGQGLAEIFFDREIEGSRIMVTNDAGMILSNTLIASNSEMQRYPDDEGCELLWYAVEYADDRCEWRHLKLKFDSPDKAEAFYLTFLEGKSYAEQTNIVDEISADGEYETYHYEQ